LIYADFSFFYAVLCFREIYEQKLDNNNYTFDYIYVNVLI